MGDSLGVPVTVTNTGSTDLTGVTLGNGITGGGPETKVSKVPAGTKGFGLSAGSHATFVYTIKGLRAGTATLTVSVSGTTPGGGTVTGADTKTVQVGARPLQISIVTTPAKIGLEVDAKGKLTPKTVTVKVTLTNKTKATLKGISLESVNPVPADPTQALDQLRLAKGSVPLKIAALAGGKCDHQVVPAEGHRRRRLSRTGPGDLHRPDPARRQRACVRPGRCLQRHGPAAVVPCLAGPGRHERRRRQPVVRHRRSAQPQLVPDALPAAVAAHVHRQRRGVRAAADQPGRAGAAAGRSTGTGQVHAVHTTGRQQR